MTRNVFGPVLATALLATALVAPNTGCKASASAQAGGGEAKPPPPPPPPPPPAATTPPPPPPAAEEPKKIKPPSNGSVKGSQVNIPGHIVYDTGKATIKPESEPTLTQLKQFLDDNPQVTLLRIEGHTDSDGDDAMNLKLSGLRALACVTWLTGKGISRDRLIAVGFGETKPIAPNDTPANKEQNRRTEFHIASLDGKNFLGRPADGGGSVVKLGRVAGREWTHEGLRGDRPAHKQVSEAGDSFPDSPKAARATCRSRRFLFVFRRDGRGTAAPRALATSLPVFSGAGHSCGLRSGGRSRVDARRS